MCSKVNANCYLEKAEEFAMAAAAAGYDYPAVIERIVELAVERQVSWFPSGAASSGARA